jgi:hypothetical protein
MMSDNPGSELASQTIESENQLDSSNPPVNSDDPRSQRAQSRQAKQLEYEILQLSSKFVSEINQQSACMIDFLDKFTHSVESESHSISTKDVDSFVNETELKIKDIVETHEKLKVINENEVNHGHEKLLNEFLSDVDTLKTQIQSRRQEEEEILNEEQALQDAKEKLEQQMQAYKTKRDIFLRKVESSKVSSPSLVGPHTRAAASSTPNTDRFNTSNLPSAEETTSTSNQHPGDTQGIH